MKTPGVRELKERISEMLRLVQEKGDIQARDGSRGLSTTSTQAAW